MSEGLGLGSLRGQSEIVRKLRIDLAKNRLASAYLFVGQDGVGKRTAARAFAAEGLCEDGSACGHCPSCSQFRAQSHPGLRQVAPSSDRGSLPSLKISDVEEVLAEMSMQPYGGRRRFVIILDVHTGTVVGLNRLLKIVEEPPPGTTLILTAPSRESVLPTVASRCRTLSFRPLGAADLALLGGPQGERKPWLTGTVKGLEMDEDTDEDLKAVEACLKGGFSSESLAGLFPPGVSGDRARVLGRLDLCLLALGDATRVGLGLVGEKSLPGIATGGGPWGPQVSINLQERVVEAMEAISANANVSLAAEAFCIRAGRIAEGSP